MHPLSIKLWCLAARWEAEHNLNMPAARTLIQRAIRLCPEADLLCKELFSLELAYWSKIHLRRQVLGIQQASSSSTEPNHQEEKTEDVDGDGDALTMMKIVVNHAVQNIGPKCGMFLWEALMLLNGEQLGEKKQESLLSFIKAVEDLILETMKSNSTSSIHYQILYQWNNAPERNAELFWKLLHQACHDISHQPEPESITFC